MVLDTDGTEHAKWVKKKTSLVMMELASLPGGEKVTLVQMLRYLRGRAFGMIMVLLAVLSLIPNLFGHTILTGLLIMILGLQMALGYTHIRLPRKVLGMSFSRAGLKKVMEVTAPQIARIEFFLKPRLIFMTEDIGRRIIGSIIIPLAFLILIPFPLSNAIPALGILILSLGLIEKDGLVVLLGISISAGAVLVIYKVVTGIF